MASSDSEKSEDLEFGLTVDDVDDRERRGRELQELRRTLGLNPLTDKQRLKAEKKFKTKEATRAKEIRDLELAAIDAAADSTARHASRVLNYNPGETPKQRQDRMKSASSDWNFDASSGSDDDAVYSAAAASAHAAAAAASRVRAAPAAAASAPAADVRRRKMFIITKNPPSNVEAGTGAAAAARPPPSLRDLLAQMEAQRRADAAVADAAPVADEHEGGRKKTKSNRKSGRKSNKTGRKFNRKSIRKLNKNGRKINRKSSRKSRK